MSKLNPQLPGRHLEMIYTYSCPVCTSRQISVRVISDKPHREALICVSCGKVIKVDE